MNTLLPSVVIFCALVAGPDPAHAQVQRGMIHGIARDTTGAVLPGAALTLTSELTAPQETIAGPLGGFRFLNLDPGRYDVRVALDGFAPYLRQGLIVGVGATVDLVLELELAARAEVVRVIAATPVLDTRRQGNVTNFDRVMLNEIPTARDPWALMQHLPGVVISRPNVGGSQSATQAGIVARGDGGSNTSWNIDGVTITDPAAPGGSSTYFDFNAFEEVQFTTGGLDPRQQAGGLGINIVTKRGTNAWRGLGRLYFTNDDLQRENLPSSLQARGLTGNRVRQIAEYGGDIGGPVRKDRVWLWGAAARNDIRQLAFTGYPDNAILNTISTKADAQLAATNRFSFFLHRAQKLVSGRGAGVDRPPETTWNQGGRTWIYKFEDSHVFGQSLFVSGKFAYVDETFFLTPKSGLNAQAYLDQATNIWHGSQTYSSSVRAVSQTHLDGVWSRGRHEVTFGGSHRRGTAHERFGWPGDQTWTLINVPGLPTGVGQARLTRASATSGEGTTLGVYVGDRLAAGPWTLTAGVRFDRQQARNLESSAAANGLFPDRLPSVAYPGGPRSTWHVLSPRLGATYRLSDRTLLRASYARFGSQLHWLNTVYVTNPAQNALIEYLFRDENGDHLAQRSELEPNPTGFVRNVDPANPSALSSPNQIDPSLGPPVVQSIVGALEHELRPNFAVSVSAGYGRAVDQLWQPFIGLTREHFVEFRTVGEAGGSVSDTPVYRLAAGSSLPPGNGVRVSNRDGYHQQYWNLDLTATRRLADRWMIRGFVTFQRHQEFFDDASRSVQDPTPRVAAPMGGLTSGFIDGGLAIPTADPYINAKWSYSLAGLYEALWGVTLSGTVYGRQGYPIAEVLNIVRAPLAQTGVLLDRDLDAHRYDNLHLLDVRAQKIVAVARTRMTVTVDVFNLLNTAVTLKQVNTVGSTFRNPAELVPPRLVRLGLQVRF